MADEVDGPTPTARDTTQVPVSVRPEAPALAQTSRSTVRLIDVAAVAGVSQKTVSNVVNEYPFVAPQTRERVLAAIEKLGYRPNFSARNLARGRSGTIALVIPELPNPYFSQLAALTLRETDRLSLAVLIEQTGGERSREQLAISGQRSRLVDGIIMSVSSLNAEDLASRSDTTPLVVLGERVRDSPVEHVIGDNVAAAQELTQHLVDQGRRRIAAIGMERALQPGLVTLRHEGYRRALEANGIPLDADLVVEVPSLTRQAGRMAVTDLLERQDFDAVLCFNDLLAAGALKALTEHGRRVPDDVAVAGFDNNEDGLFSTPALTTVDWHTDQIVQRAVDLLHSRITGVGTVSSGTIVIPHSLVVRGSTVASTCAGDPAP